MQFRINGRRPIGLAAALLFSTSLAGIAHAEEAPAAPAAPAADAADSTDENQIGTVTVYARKRAENVQDVPIPVTVITPAELTRQNLMNFSDFQAKIPSFSVYLTNPKQLNIGIRGIGNNGFNTDGLDSSVGVFIDGVYTGRPGMVSSDFNDLAEVEVLRGPQGTLFGKNTTAGAVIINSLKPSFDFGVTGEASAGDWGLAQVKASVTGAIIPDKLAVRVSGYYTTTDGTYPNLYNNGYQNARQGQGIRAQLLFTPTSNLSVRIIGTYNHQFFPTTTPVAVGVYNPPANCAGTNATGTLYCRMQNAGYALTIGNAANRQVNINSELDAHTETRTISGEINWDLGKGGTITSITAYEHWMCYTNNDNDYTQLNALPDYGSCNTEHQFSQELRWSTNKGGAIEATAGGFLSRQHLDVYSHARFGDQAYLYYAAPAGFTAANWYAGSYSPQVNGASFFSNGTFNSDTNALFGNASWHPDAGHKLSVDGGLRYTWEQKNYVYSSSYTNPGNLSLAQIQGLSAAGAANAAYGVVPYTKLSTAQLSGEAGLSYKVTPAVLLYFKYAHGAKSAGFNLTPIAAPHSQTVSPETADNFEAGIKSEWFDHHLVFNLTAFHTVVYNYQANAVLADLTKLVANVGSETSNGVEAEAEAWLAKGLHLKGFIAYDHAYYSSFPNSPCPSETQFTAAGTPCKVNGAQDLTGRTVAWAPKWTADLSVDYTHPVGEGKSVYGLADVNWRTSYNTTTILDPLANISGYALVNARVGLTLDHGRFDINIWSNNLLNKSYFINDLGLNAKMGVVQSYPGNPRSFGLTVRVRYGQ